MDLNELTKLAELLKPHMSVTMQRGLEPMSERLAARMDKGFDRMCEKVDKAIDAHAGSCDGPRVAREVKWLWRVLVGVIITGLVALAIEGWRS